MEIMMVKTAPRVPDMAFYGRAHRGEHYSGDVAFIHRNDTKIFVAVVDAAGHGRSAHRVATKIEKIFRSGNTDELAGLIQFSHQRLKGGPGAVIIAGALDAESLDFTYVHIGDTHGKVFGPRRRTLVGQAGMLGHAIRTPSIQSETLSAGDTLVLCTDGISERYDLNEIQRYSTMPADALARRIVEQFGKDHDDATCLVVRCA